MLCWYDYPYSLPEISGFQSFLSIRLFDVKSYKILKKKANSLQNFIIPLRQNIIENKKKMNEVSLSSDNIF